MVVDSATFPFPFLVAARASAQPGSFFGVEGGHAVLVGKDVYVVITEFTAPPLWVPSKIALWRGSLLPPSSSRAAIRCCSSWRRIRTLFTSGGKTDCKSTRASLGSSAALAYDADEGSWNVFCVGFVSCNDTSFVNRRGRIFRAVATVAGLQLLLFFSGYDQKLPPHPSLPSMNPKSAADSYHESMGLALFKLGESTSGTYAYIGSSAP